ncbi:fructose-specific PTS transporter subunit EIIC [Geobacillus stearothermophilus]|nr:fructose-specific PTS transporter subunit EIIC [Geobacillus stearothermophilus]MED3785049.1 fructose-specific PTS transporter subunit EIIC [Geobacillus stearothermophilus]
MKLVAVTSCPVGIAHTYMAAEKLQKTANEMGIEIKVETQGSVGVENELTPEDIAQADGVIIAADKGIDMSRFVGKKVIETSTSEAIKNAESLIQQFQTGNVPVYQEKTTLKTIEEVKQERKSKQHPIYKHLMNGVSYMIPFVVFGGIMIALALALGGTPGEKGLEVKPGSVWESMLNVGVASFGLMIPILAGFIAMSIADRPGLAPGMVGGFIAANGSFYDSQAGAGFLGGIVAGFLAGYIVLWIKKWRVPKIIQPIMPILIIPIVSTSIVAAIFIWVIGAPFANMMTGLTNFLSNMSGTSSVVLALILGAMIAFDMGGPVNKVAFLFGSSMIQTGNIEIMGAIAAAICTPPIGMGVATFLNKKKYEKEELEAGKAAFAMGLVGITEGAIPFAAKDPLRVIPSIMVGSMVASVIAMLGHVGNHVPHGGPIVAVLGAVTNWTWFVIAIVAGVLVTAIMVNTLKKDIEA